MKQSRVKTQMRSEESTLSLWTLNYQVAMSLILEVNAAVRALGLEMKELFLLLEVDAHPSPADLARALCMPKPSVTFLVKGLEKAGILKRTIAPDDLRRFHLAITPRGRTTMEKARRILEKGFEKRLLRLGEKERGVLRELLGRLVLPG